MMYFTIIFVALVVILLLTGLHFVLYKYLIGIFPAGRHLAIVFGTLPAILTAGFVFVSFIAFRYNNFISRGLYWFFSTWLGLGFYLILAGVIYWLIIWLLKMFGVQVNAVLFGRLLLVAAIITVIYGLVNAQKLVITDLKLNIPNLPASWQGRRAVWISDIHLDQIHNYSYAKELAEKISVLNPDILFVGGDFFDGTAIDLNKITAPFANIKPPLGTYYITGNHEEFGDPTKYINAVAGAGMRVLMNESVVVDGVRIIGVDYKTTSDVNKYEEIIKKLTADKSFPMILLKHEPKDVGIAAENGISLEISGHTHRLQMFPLGLFTELVYGKYYYGLHQVGDMIHYTSDGVGTWGPPLRVGTYSEIVTMEFSSN